MNGETFMGLATNLGFLSVCAILVTILAASGNSWLTVLSSSALAGRGSRFSVGIGLTFGLTCAGLILSAHTIHNGTVLDTRAGPAILSGVIGGPVAAALTFALGGLARAWVGGPFVVGGVASVGIYAFSGLIIARLLKLDMTEMGWAFHGRLALVGLLCTLTTFPAFFLNQDVATALAAAAVLMPIILVQNPIAVLLLGSALKLTLQVVHDRAKLTRLSADLDIRNKQLQEANSSLEAANIKLRDFSSIAAHDLKAPLRRLEMLMSYMAQDLQDLELDTTDDILENTELAQKTIVAMRTLVQDLIFYSLSDVSEADPHSFDPAPRIEAVIDQLGLAETFTVQLLLPLPVVCVPGTAFDIVIRNLVSNAIKHHDRPSGTIKISAWEVGGMVTFEIRDDGPGIPEKHLERIFQPFETLKPKSKTQSSGLGLSFVAKLTEEWGGTVSAHSPDARGSTFCFTLPAGSPG